MKNMEKGITDDIKRIQAKGKTFHDIPRKEWFVYILCQIIISVCEELLTLDIKFLDMP